MNRVIRPPVVRSFLSVAGAGSMRRGSIAVASSALLVLIAARSGNIPGHDPGLLVLTHTARGGTGRVRPVAQQRTESAHLHQRPRRALGYGNAGFGNDVPPVVFRAAGIYAYLCRIHPFMHGQ